MVLQTRSLLIAAIFKSAILCFAVSISSDSVAFCQFDDARMRRIYESNISKLPNLRVAVTFKSVLSKEEFDERYKKWTDAGLAELMSLTDKEIQDALASQGVTAGGRDTAKQMYLTATAKGKPIYQQKFETRGRHEHTTCDATQEIRSFGLDGKMQKILQYGFLQPKLENADLNRWVIRDAEETEGRGVLFSSSTISLRGMLPVGCYHPTIEQEFSSEFGEFWDNASKIVYIGEIQGNHIFLKKHPKFASPRYTWKESWLIGSFSKPEESIVPDWIAHINAPGKSGLTNKDTIQMVTAVHAIEEHGHALVPTGLYLIKLIEFANHTTVGQFGSYPREIKYTSFVDWKSKEGTHTECWPLQSHRLDITAIAVNENEVTAISVEDGDSYYDHDLKVGWIIGQPQPRIVAQRSSSIRLAMWLVAGLAMAAFVYFYVRK